MSIKFDLNTAEFDKDIDQWIRKNRVDFGKAMISATFEMHKMAKKKVNQQAKGVVRSGHLANEIHPRVYNRGLTGEIISHASYSDAFEEGTRPHIIRIRNKRILAGPARGAPPGWNSFSGDYATYGIQVRHPGTEPHPFMFPAWLWGIKKLENGIKAAMK